MIRNVIFNGKPGRGEIARPWILALNDPGIVTEKAGFLFKAAVRDDHLLLAASPVLINGDRLCHYQLNIQNEDAYTLIGDLSATGEFTILFKPESLPLTPEQKQRYLHRFQVFSAWLLNAGYSGEGILSHVTQMVLTDIGLSPAPRTLAELSASAQQSTI